MTTWQGNQAAQADFLRYFAPGWYLYEGGYGAGKSWAGARKLLTLHLVNGCPSAVYAPTYGDLWRVCVPEIMRAAEELNLAPKVCPQGSAARPYPHVMVGAHPIIVQSGDDPGRIAGYEVGALWIDEAARLPESASVPQRDAPTQIRARLRHPHAKTLMGICTTTPEGTETWIQRDFREKPLPKHWAWRGRTAENKALTPEYAVSIRAAFGEELARQYLEGEAVDYRKDTAHATFTEAANVSEGADWPGKHTPAHSVPVHIGMDFNVSPLAWVAGWVAGDVLNIAEELVVPDFAQVDDGMARAHALGWGSRGHVTIHPDRSGSNRNRVGDPECTVVEREARRLGWSASVLTYGANPNVNQRINQVSRQVRDALGVSRLRVHPRCRVLIDEFKRTGRRGSGYDAGKDGKRGHILDALGYLVWDLTEQARAEVARIKL